MPAQGMLISGNSLDDFTMTRRTVLQLPHGEQRELQDEWGVKQTRVLGNNGEHLAVFRVQTASQSQRKEVWEGAQRFGT